MAPYPHVPSPWLWPQGEQLVHDPIHSEVGSGQEFCVRLDRVDLGLGLGLDQLPLQLRELNISVLAQTSAHSSLHAVKES